MRLAVVLLVVAVAVQRVRGWQKWTEEAGPGAREGHTLLLYGRNLVLFGGRGNDDEVEHIPRTYEIVRVNGTIQVPTYDQKPVRECGQDEACNTTALIGTYHNDVWTYPLDCERYGDLPCYNQTWTLVHSGALLGGCVAAGQCTTPTERFMHGAALFGTTMVIYGGYSQMCGDYCSDMWQFDFPTRQWTLLMELGQRSGPGARWRFSSVFDDGSLYVFGGHRLWHGYAADNDASNSWQSTALMPLGGYLDDLWHFQLADLSWSQLQKKAQCGAAPGVSWEDRHRQSCTITWPSERASHAALLHGRHMYVHGGYRAFFPYPDTSGPGSATGTGAVTRPGQTPYPTHPYFLDDFWRFDLDSGLWVELTPASAIKPAARMGHSLVQAGAVFLLFGGYSPNFFRNDFWQYTPDNSRWLLKSTFVHPIYPDNCTSDIGTELKSVLGQPTRGIPDLLPEEHVFIPLQRRRAPGWDGCRDRADGRADLPAQLQWLQPSQRRASVAVFDNVTQALMLYGGFGYVLETATTLQRTEQSLRQSDLWQYSLSGCPANCSGNGDCRLGYCFCDEGFYGIDCSNISCPGDFCFYDALTNVQHCQHCCSAGFEHSAEQTEYVRGVTKLSCSLEQPGASNGICDGFGQCLCSPGFITDDCSVKDCPNACSGHGWCSVEYPISRCICDGGFSGSDCSTKLCLNNCSYPNGNCADGICQCSMVFNPFNRTRDWRRYAGVDCSYLIPFAAAPRGAHPSWLLLAAVAALAFFMQQQQQQVLR